MFWKKKDPKEEDLLMARILADAYKSMSYIYYNEFNMFIRRIGMFNLFVEYMSKNEKIEKYDVPEKYYERIRRIVIDSCAKNTMKYEDLTTYLRICKKLGILDRLRQDITNKKFIRFAEVVDYL